MTAFPQTIHFIGSNMPRRTEISIRNLAVEGEIPAEIDGAFFRAVPDNAHAPMFEDDVALNADGMIARFNIENGAISRLVSLSSWCSIAAPSLRSTSPGALSFSVRLSTRPPQLSARKAARASLRL